MERGMDQGSICTKMEISSKVSIKMGLLAGSEQRSSPMEIPWQLFINKTAPMAQASTTNKMALNCQANSPTTSYKEKRTEFLKMAAI